VKSDAGHYNYRVGQHFKKGKYEVTKFLSDGTFGRVVEVKNLNDNKFYAMKVQFLTM
jgi:CDC-like kinase